MTVYDLNDIYRLGAEEISFFVFLLIFSSVLFRLAWNSVVKAVPRLPKLGYRQALCASFVFGLMMLLILTMISGIREVLTPEAWHRQGSHYRLNSPSMETTRREGLAQLRGALFAYAREHDGKFPPHDFVPEIPEKLWQSPDPSGSHYIYLGGFSTNDIQEFLAYEPAHFGDTRWAMMGSGEIVQIAQRELEAKYLGGASR